MMLKKFLIVSLIIVILTIAGFSVLIFADPFNYQGVEEIIDKKTVLEIEEGDIMVNAVKAESGLVLQENDLVEVGKNSGAVIYFFDDTVTRLGPDSKVKLVVLDDNNYEYGQSQILLDLQSGEAWSKVQKQTSPDISFSVKTIQVNATIRGSALDVVVDQNGKSTVAATEHSFLLEQLDPVTGLVIDQKLVLEDQKAQILNGNIMAISELSDFDKKKKWFKNNQELDNILQEELIHEAQKRLKQEAGALPGSFGFRIKNLQDWKNLNFAGDRHDEIKLKIAERKLSEAGAMLLAGEADPAEEQMKSAEEIFRELSSQDKDKWSPKINKSLQGIKNNLRQTLPNDANYPLKDFVMDMEIDLADMDKRTEMIQRKIDKQILDIYDLSKKVPFEEMQIFLEQFKDGVQKSLDQNADLKNIIHEQISNPYLDRLLKVQNAEERMQIINDFFGDRVKLSPALRSVLESMTEEMQKNVEEASKEIEASLREDEDQMKIAEEELKKAQAEIQRNADIARQQWLKGQEAIKNTQEEAVKTINETINNLQLLDQTVS